MTHESKEEPRLPPFCAMCFPRMAQIRWDANSPFCTMCSYSRLVTRDIVMKKNTYSEVFIWTIQHLFHSNNIIILLNNIEEKMKEEGGRGHVYTNFTTGKQGRGWRIANQQDAY